MLDAKSEAVRCWTNDPCGAVDGEPGTREYAERLVRARREYAPWMAELLGYESASGLDVLDVGCGQGIDLVEFARAGAAVTGLDLTPRHVELARAHLAALDLDGTVVEGDSEEMPFPDRSFDRVTSNGVLHHTPRIDLALAEARRVLRPGGDARVILYHRDSLHYWLGQVAVEGLLHGGLRREKGMSGVLSTAVERSRVAARPLVRVYGRGQVRRLFRAAGFADVRVAVRHFHWGDVPKADALFGRLHEPAWIGNRLGWYVIGLGRAR